MHATCNHSRRRTQARAATASVSRLVRIVLGSIRYRWYSVASTIERYHALVEEGVGFTRHPPTGGLREAQSRLACGRPGLCPLLFGRRTATVLHDHEVVEVRSILVLRCSETEPNITFARRSRIIRVRRARQLPIGARIVMTVENDTANVAWAIIAVVAGIPQVAKGGCCIHRTGRCGVCVLIR